MPLRTEEMTLNMGPHHPSTHGVLRFILASDGEVVHSCKPDVGYLHRSIEKIGEKMTYLGFMPYTDRVDYVCAMNANWGYALAVEKLAGIAVPRRAEFIRVIVGELNRISSHLVALGTMAMDLGAITPFPWALRERERVNDLLEEICGARLTYNYVWIGGVAFDVPAGWLEKARSFVDSFERMIPEFDRLITGNKIFHERLVGVGVIDRETALGYGISGPNLRASGVAWDIRRDIPYGIYPELEFDVPVGACEAGALGDCYCRFRVRVREMEESVKIVRQCIDRFPHEELEFRTKLRRVKPPIGSVYVASEAPRGELGFLILSNGTEYAERMRIRTGSFTAMSVLEKIAPGLMVADLVAVIASLDVVAPEIDR
ncbi:MAG: NADH-quinone oxidoreductase subunit D [Candidatus Latescibacterota bacterium]|nr:MAG: NADH-quinone oxidoreductase subunit D [Candidatus Latescibacterota bacterium]